MDKFSQIIMKKVRPIKSIWSDRLINHIHELLRKSVGGFEDKIISPRQNTPKQTVHGRGNNLSKPKT